MMEKICLECTLPICDERSKECAYVQITRTPKREQVAAWYQANTERKKAYVANWSKENMDKKVAANRRYREKKRLSASTEAANEI